MLVENSANSACYAVPPSVASAFALASRAAVMIDATSLNPSTLAICKGNPTHRSSSQAQ